MVPSIGVMAAHWSVTHPYRMMWTFLTVMTVRAAGLGITMPMWGDLVRRLFPDSRRGQTMGIIVSVSSLFGILGAAYARYILHRVEFPADFSHLFIAAGILMTVAATLYYFARELAPPAVTTTGPQPSYGSVVRAALKTDRRFRRFITVLYIYQIGAAVAIFFAVYGLEHFALPPEIAGTFTVLLMAARAGGALLLGRLGDRRGYRRVLGWGILAMFGATVVALVSPNISLFYTVFILLGIANAAAGVGFINMVIEICPHEDKSVYVALVNTALIPVQIGAPVLLGYLADRLGVSVILGAAAGLQLAGLVALLTLVDDPRRPGRRVLRWPPHRWLPRFT